MNTFTLVLTSLLLLTLVVMIAPNILALNRGKVLQNIAMWLAIFLVVALVYQIAGPGKNAPMFADMREEKAATPAETPATNPPAGDQGYTPPKE